MAKTKKKVKKVVDEVQSTQSNGTYHVFVKINDKTYEVDTDNIAEAIQACKPEILRTSLTVKVTKGDKTLDRYMYLNDAKRLFNNSITLEAFVRNLLF